MLGATPIFIQVEPKGIHPEMTNEKFLNDGRKRKMQAVVTSYVALAVTVSARKHREISSIKLAPPTGVPRS
jgi:hypothetical protein